MIDYQLPYPTGTAVGTMIRSFFNDGANARKQALMMAKTGLVAFTWGFWTWFTDGVCTPAVTSAAGYVSSKWTAMCVSLCLSIEWDLVCVFPIETHMRE